MIAALSGRVREAASFNLALMEGQDLSPKQSLLSDGLAVPEPMLISVFAAVCSRSASAAVGSNSYSGSVGNTLETSVSGKSKQPTSKSLTTRSSTEFGSFLEIS